MLLTKAESIWRAGLDGVYPGNLVRRSLKIREHIVEFSGTERVSKIGDLNKKSLDFGSRPRFLKNKFDLSAYERIYLIAFGKAAPAMASGLMDILGDAVRGGIVVALPDHKISIPKLRVIEAPHPFPDERSLAAGRKILALAREAGPRDLIFILLSGGGSAQVCLPLSGISFEDKRCLTRELMLRGAGIAELNIVRKHLSAVKGGRLAEAAFPAEVVNLVVSDVVGDDLEAVASGPSHWDSSRYEDALAVLQKYGLWEKAPSSVKKTISGGLAGRIEETLKKENRTFERVSSFVIGNNATALDSARRQAEQLGFKTVILTSSDRGEARFAAKTYVSLLINLAASPKRFKQPLCLLSGGELVVAVKGKGQGGRNQEFVLAFLLELERQVAAMRTVRSGLWHDFQKDGFLSGRDWLAASLGTDGIDGNTDAAGAWASPSLLCKAREQGMEAQHFLDDNDSFHFFKKAGGLIVTGPTGTNVMDLRIFFLTDKQGK